MQSKYYYFLMLLISCIILSCTDKPDFSDTPELEYLNMDNNQIVQGNLNSDSLHVFFQVKDGDGDIGVANDDSFLDLVLTDSRTGEVYSYYKSPEVPMQGSNNGIIATFQLKVFTTCCLFPENIPPCSAPDQFPMDTMQLQIQITDQAGNMSNIVETDPIILLCN